MAIASTHYFSQRQPIILQIEFANLHYLVDPMISETCKHQHRNLSLTQGYRFCCRHNQHYGRFGAGCQALQVYRLHYSAPSTLIHHPAPLDSPA